MHAAVKNHASTVAYTDIVRCFPSQRPNAVLPREWHSHSCSLPTRSSARGPVQHRWTARPGCSSA